MKTLLRFAGGLALAAATGAASAASTNASPPANIRDGEAVYTRCVACHALAFDRTGPRHCGLLGRRAGSVKGFAYSDAMRNAKIVWDEKTLDLFLANPTKVIPGTTMGYAGVPDEKERANLIAYLRQANDSPACKK